MDNLRLDTLAFDKESNAFVIIEYKKDKNFSVIDQGYAYLALLLNNKADFILEYNESKNKNLKKAEVDWSQSRVIFVSPGFTKYQRNAINFKDLPIELWEIKKYENSIILLNKIQSIETNESIKKISGKNKTVQEVTKEIKVYTEKDFFNNKSEEIWELYEELKNRILNLGENIEIKPKKKYIAFSTNTNFVDIRPQKTEIKIWLNLKRGELNDPQKLARDVSNVGHWGNGDYEISFNSESDIDYIMFLIKQAYKKHQ